VHATSPDAMVVVDEAWGGHLHFHPRCPSRDGGGRRRLRAVDPQARRRAAADGLLHWHEGRVDTS
jgi:lysine decarboxylase